MLKVNEQQDMTDQTDKQKHLLCLCLLKKDRRRTSRKGHGELPDQSQSTGTDTS